MKDLVVSIGAETVLTAKYPVFNPLNHVLNGRMALVLSNRNENKKTKRNISSEPLFQTTIPAECLVTR